LQGYNYNRHYYEFVSNNIVNIINLADTTNVDTIWQQFQISSVVNLTRKQVAATLAHAFLCSVPFHHLDNSINFNRCKLCILTQFREYFLCLFCSLYSSNARFPLNKIEKLKCLLHYLECVVSSSDLSKWRILGEQNILHFSPMCLLQ